MVGIALRQESVLRSLSGRYDFSVLHILSSVIKHWTTGSLQAAVPEIHSLAPTRE